MKKQIFRYNLRPFTDTNSVICKIIVGTPVLGCPYGDVGDGFPVPREAKRLPYEMSVKGERYMKAPEGSALGVQLALSEEWMPVLLKHQGIYSKSGVNSLRFIFFAKV